MTIRVILLGAMAAATGCVVGEASTAGVGTPDAASGSGGDVVHDARPASSGDASVTKDAAGCRDQVANPGTDGHHNPGQDCQNACHDHGFTVSGTLYTSGTGSTPISGGTITVVDAAGSTFDLVSATNGNFYASVAFDYPITISASECPSIAAMTATIPASGGCNATSCHTTSAQGHVHLP